jgi:hypothetical protein
MKYGYIIAGCLIGTLFPFSAFAQSEYGGGWAVPSLDTSISITNEIINREITSKIVRDEIAAKERRVSNRLTANDERRSQISPAVKSLNPQSLNFRPSLVLRKRNLTEFISKTRADNPEGAAQMEKLFASVDVIGTVAKGIAPYGLRTDNLADAYAVYWANAWLGSRGRSDNFEKTQILAVRSQAVSALLATPAVASASNEQKQEMAEALLVQAALIGSAVTGAKSDPALMAKVKASIAQGAKAMGLDLYTMTLTPNGFVPTKKGSAVDESDLQSGSETEEQAFASTEPLESSESPNYALIAAAGGAGLGGMFLLGRAMGRKS